MSRPDLHCRLPRAVHESVHRRAAAKNISVNAALVDLLRDGITAAGDAPDQRETRYLLRLHSHLLAELIGLLMLDDPSAVRRVLAQAEQRAAASLDSPILPGRSATHG